jgi:hypothetical protein
MRILIVLLIGGLLIKATEEKALETGYDMGFSDGRHNEPHGARFDNFKTKAAAAAAWKYFHR